MPQDVHEASPSTPGMLWGGEDYRKQIHHRVEGSVCVKFMIKQNRRSTGSETEQNVDLPLSSYAASDELHPL